MPGTPGARFGLAAFAGGDFINTLDTENAAQVAILEAHGVRVDRGTFSARPTSSGGTPGIQDRFYYATDTQDLWYDYGAGWIWVAGAAPFKVVSPAGNATAADRQLVQAAPNAIITLPAAVIGYDITVFAAGIVTGATPVTITAPSALIYSPIVPGGASSVALTGAINTARFRCFSSNQWLQS
jgi:hypothetical protein